MNHIQNYLLIGDLHTAALVSKEGSIDWLCFPHFDSPSIFARILDKKGGSFSIEHENAEIDSNYIKDTAIVEHQFKDQGDVFKIRDFMLPQQKNICDSHFLIRKIIGIEGNSLVRLHFDPQPDYAQSIIHLKKNKSIISADLNGHRLELHLPDEAEIFKSDSGYLIKIKVEKGQDREIILEYKVNHPAHIYQADLESRTRQFWHDWLAKGKFIEFCKEQMIRSAVTLKLMQYYPTGAIIASPTTSLPEEIGGVRNWDYRYVWIRDATFTLYAFHILGYQEELLKFFNFIENIAEDGKGCGEVIHLMYTIKGSSIPAERELKHMQGFERSVPVRTGNAASEQFQLDMYGSLIDAYYFIWCNDRFKLSNRARGIIVSLVGHIEGVWNKKDEGIWEMRSGRQHFTYSKVMAWVGVNRALRMSEALNISKDKQKNWSKLEREIKQWIWDNCFNEELGSFTQHPDTKNQDATNLLFVLLQFLDRHDELTKSIINKTCKELAYKKSFIYRYHSDDDLVGKEGAFVLCTFWMIAAFAAVEEIDKALSNYYHFRDYMDETMLMSEEIDPDTGEYLGNFPQAFSHMGLILAAFFVNKYKERLDFIPGEKL